VPFDLVILDCDGVLVDSEPIANQIMREALKTLGLSMTLDEVMSTFVGRSMASCRTIIEARLGRAAPATFFDELHRRTFEAFQADLEIVDGVEELLNALAVPCCVASSGSHAKIRCSLGAVGLLDRFEGRIFSAEDVARGKPAPDLFLHVGRSMGATPAACAVIEDSVPGVQAAVAAGMTAYAYAPPDGHTSPDVLTRARAAAVVQHLRALADPRFGLVAFNEKRPAQGERSAGS